jgi:hypothetical protein
MRVNGVKLNSFQIMFAKDLMGDLYMSDTRAESRLTNLGAKYGVDVVELLQTASKTWEAKNAEFKKLEAEDLAKV